MAHIYGSKLYHNSFSSAVQMAQSDAETNGYEVDEQSWFINVTTGKGRPKQGETTRFSVELLKDELNHYIN